MAKYKQDYEKEIQNSEASPNKTIRYYIKVFTMLSEMLYNQELYLLLQQVTDYIDFLKSQIKRPRGQSLSKSSYSRKSTKPFKKSTSMPHYSGTMRVYPLQVEVAPELSAVPIMILLDKTSTVIKPSTFTTQLKVSNTRQQRTRTRLEPSDH